MTKTTKDKAKVALANLDDFAIDAIGHKEMDLKFKYVEEKRKEIFEKLVLEKGAK